MNRKIHLNFFGEKVDINPPSTLESLRTIISNQYLFSPSDTAELLLYHISSHKKIIASQKDFEDFLKESISLEMIIDINAKSKLYQEKVRNAEKEEVYDSSAGLKEELRRLQQEERESIEIQDEKEKELFKLYHKMQIYIQELTDIKLQLKTKRTEFRMNYSKREEIQRKIKEIQSKLDGKVEDKNEGVNMKDDYNRMNKMQMNDQNFNNKSWLNEEDSEFGNVFRLEQRWKNCKERYENVFMNHVNRPNNCFCDRFENRYGFYQNNHNPFHGFLQLKSPDTLQNCPLRKEGAFNDAKFYID